MTAKIRRRQGGYTLVETIVAITVGAIVMAAIFPVFLLLYRVETTWGEATQARATGLLAEESLARDIRAYRVDQLDPLTLRTVGEQPLYIDYALDDAGRLIRTVRENGIAISSVIVAHGIEKITATCSGDSAATIRLAIWTTGIGGPSVRLRPNLVVTPRNPQGCP